MRSAVPPSYERCFARRIRSRLRPSHSARTITQETHACSRAIALEKGGMTLYQADHETAAHWVRRGQELREWASTNLSDDRQAMLCGGQVNE